MGLSTSSPSGDLDEQHHVGRADGALLDILFRDLLRQPGQLDDLFQVQVGVMPEESSLYRVGALAISIGSICGG